MRLAVKKIVALHPRATGAGRQQLRWVHTYGAALAASFFVIVAVQLIVEHSNVLLTIEKYFKLDYDHLRAFSLAPAFVVYFFLIREVLQRKVVTDVALRTIIKYFFLFGGLFLLVTPGPGSDFYHYLFEDRALVVHQQNPFFVPPNQLPAEPSGWLAAWRHVPAQHGPMRNIVMVPAAVIGQSSLVLHIYLANLTIFIFLLGSVVLVHRLALHINPATAPAAVMLYGWNPLLLHETLHGGGAEVTMIFWALLSLQLLFYKRWFLAVAMLTFSVLVKYATLFLPPLFALYAFFQVRQPSRRALLFFGGALILSAITVVIFMPFWQGPGTLQGTLYNGLFFNYNSFPAMIAAFFSFINPAVDRYLFKYLAAAAFFVIYGYLVVRIVQRRSMTFLRLIETSAIVMLLLL